MLSGERRATIAVGCPAVIACELQTTAFPSMKWEPISGLGRLNRLRLTQALSKR